MIKKPLSIFFVCITSLFFLLSCGLETFSYIDDISQANVQSDLIHANILLPSPDETYFEQFDIFYRIYMSDLLTTAKIETDDDRTNINTLLQSDYNSFKSYIDYTSTTRPNTSGLENTFYTRNFFKLELEGVPIASLLGDAVRGGQLTIDFTQNNMPTLRINGSNPYVLQRAVYGNSKNFIPKPDLHFLNHPDLYSLANATNQINADIARKDTAPRYTYVLMYILATGKSADLPPVPIYGLPACLGIFKLPEYTSITN